MTRQHAFAKLSLATLLLAGAAISAPAQANERAAETAPAAAGIGVGLTLGSGPVETRPVTYACGKDATLAATYVNAGSNDLAILPVEGTVRVFVSTLSASGARYVSGPYEWWTKGEEAVLRNLMQDEKSAPLQTCKAVVAQP